MSATVRIELTAADRKVATRYACGYLRQVFTGLRIALMGIGAVAIGFALAGDTGGFVGYVAFVVVLIAVMVQARRKAKSQRATAPGGTTLTVDGQSMVAEAPDAWIRRAWDTVAQAKVENGRLLIKLKAGTVFCVPLRCFESPEIEAEFLDIVATHVRTKGRRARDLTPVAPL